MPKIYPISSTIGDMQIEKVTLDDFAFLRGTDSVIAFGSDTMTAYVITEAPYVLGKMTARFGLPHQEHAPYAWKVHRRGISLPRNFNCDLNSLPDVAT